MAVTRPDTVALIPPNAAHSYQVTAADLPLSCPMPGMYLWSSHPRVFLAIGADRPVVCPYCGAEYRLT